MVPNKRFGTPHDFFLNGFSIIGTMFRFDAPLIVTHRNDVRQERQHSFFNIKRILNVTLYDVS